MIDAFLERIIAHPDDDGPRLVFADWLDEHADPRGQFIRLQCALARLPAEDPRRFELTQREEALLDAHYATWTAPFRGLASGLEFRRGFVEVVNIEARAFLLRAETLLQLTPICHVRLLDVGSSLNAVANSPHVAKLSALTMFAQHLGDPVARILAESPYLSRLATLELGRNRLTDAGVKAIAESRCLDQLTVLDLGDNHLTDLAAQTLAASPYRMALQRLDLRRNEIGPDGLDALAASPRLPALTHLNLGHNRIGVPRAFVPLTASTGVPRLRHLDARANAIGSATIHVITGSPHLTGLHSLDLGFNELGNAGTVALGESSSLASLRSLYLNDNHIADEGIRALANSPHLNYLATLDLSHNPMINDMGARALLESRNLRSLRRLAPPGLGLSHQMRRALLARYGIPLRRNG